MAEIDSAIARIEKGDVGDLYLVTGDRIVSEPVAIRLGQALAESIGCQPDVVRRPDSLLPALHDLRTLALFDSGKVTVVVESSVLADVGTAASLVDEAIEVLPVASADVDLDARERRAAACLLQALRLFQLDPYAGSSEDVIASLPASALEGGPALRKKTRRRRSAKQADTARENLPLLLEVARRDELQGFGETDEEMLADIVLGGLPEGHALILAESVWADSHPLVEALRDRGAVITTGQVSPGKRSGWLGLDLVRKELERETGVGIDKDALVELARRTLRKKASSRARDGAIDSESTARLGAEYRKLANLAPGSSIVLGLVEDVVQDRGDEDIWAILDAVGEGRAGEAVAGIDRLLRGSQDVVGTRLSLFSMLAGFCRQLAAVDGMVKASGVPPSERSYARFKERIAPRLQAELGAGRKNPLAGLHPFRLHRVYLAASRLGEDGVERLPSRVLATEKMLKGGTRVPDAALVALVAGLATNLSSGVR